MTWSVALERYVLLRSVRISADLIIALIAPNQMFGLPRNGRQLVFRRPGFNSAMSLMACGSESRWLARAS